MLECALLYNSEHLPLSVNCISSTLCGPKYDSLSFRAPLTKTALYSPRKSKTIKRTAAAFFGESSSIRLGLSHYLNSRLAGGALATGFKFDLLSRMSRASNLQVRALSSPGSLNGTATKFGATKSLKKTTAPRYWLTYTSYLMTSIALTPRFTSKEYPYPS